MSKMETSADELSAAELNLGKALVLLQRLLPRLDEPGRAADVQADLRNAGACIEAARLAHAQHLTLRRAGTASQAQPSIDAETAAIISAAIASVLSRPYRLVSVEPVAAPAPHFNVWAFEGRTQIFQSHKVR